MHKVPTAVPPTAARGAPVPHTARMAPRRIAALTVELLRPVPMVGLHTGHRTRAVLFMAPARSTLARQSDRGLRRLTTERSSRG